MLVWIYRQQEYGFYCGTNDDPNNPDQFDKLIYRDDEYYECGYIYVGY